MSKKIPVLVLAFNRADHVQQAMKAIAEYQPDRLYLECDGPRPHKEGEKEAVEETQKVMLDMVTWPCEVKTLFREDNLGCANAVSSAIDWFFENEEYGCIIEDDIVVSQDFFTLCEDLLPRYKEEERIMQISARNTSFRTDINNKYVYAQCFHCWGWATWKRAWDKMDMKMKGIHITTLPYLIKRLGVFRGCMFNHFFRCTHSKLEKSTSWAIRWYHSIMCQDGLVICPGVNLAINIGMDGGAHFTSEDAKRPGAKLQLHNIEWPIVYNDTLELDTIQKKCDSKFYFQNRYFGLKKKIRKLIK